jgi:hypothetical protein
MNQLMQILTVASAVAASDVAGLVRSPCDADLKHDGIAGGSDLAIVLGDCGLCKNCQGEVTENGAVDGIDLAFVLTLWGGRAACLGPLCSSNHQTPPSCLTRTCARRSLQPGCTGEFATTARVSRCCLCHPGLPRWAARCRPCFAATRARTPFTP